MVDIPGVDAGSVDFGNGKGECVVADANGEFGAAISGKLFGIIETDNAAFGVEYDGGRDYGAEERAAAGFVNAGDARPAEFARRSLKTGRAKTAHIKECSLDKLPDRILACRRGGF